MRSYQIRLCETRMSSDDHDDVALFEVTCEEDGRVWRVVAILSPLFRVLHKGSLDSVEGRRDMIAGLGTRAIAERLKQGLEPTDKEIMVFAVSYPGAPGAPDPLLPCDEVTVCVDGAEPESSTAQE
jgi:hypothetical protein